MRAYGELTPIIGDWFYDENPVAYKGVPGQPVGVKDLYPAVVSQVRAAAKEGVAQKIWLDGGPSCEVALALAALTAGDKKFISERNPIISIAVACYVRPNNDRRRVVHYDTQKRRITVYAANPGPWIGSGGRRIKPLSSILSKIGWKIEIREIKDTPYDSECLDDKVIVS